MFFLRLDVILRGQKGDITDYCFRCDFKTRRTPFPWFCRIEIPRPRFLSYLVNFVR